MRLPNMPYKDNISKSKQIKFGGLNHTTGARDGELWDMRNLTGDHYPVLASRQPRKLYRRLANGGGLYAWNELCWVDGTTFYFAGEAKGQVTEGQKTFSSIGAYIVIFPDKCYYNADIDEFGSLEAKWSGKSLTFCDGFLYEEAAQANCIQCAETNWGEYFHQGDAVTIAGCTENPCNNQTIIIRAIDRDKLYFYEHSFSLLNGEAYEEEGTLSIERTVPELLHLCEHENRLWGCTEDTIYASKLGDIFNWNVYDGLDTDAWAVDAGSAGRFTGCISFMGYPVFFKEDHIYKVYGSLPSNFKVMGSATMGLAEGAGRSLAVAGETLFYLNRSGIMAYTGGIPQPIGRSFGTKKFSDAVGGSDGLKYYVSMRDEAGSWGLYVYDTQHGLWHLEDESCVAYFAKWEGNLYFLNTKGEVWITGAAQAMPETAETEEPFPWMAEFTDFTEEDPNKKGISKFQLRLELDEGALLQVWLQSDSDGEFKKVSEILGEGSKRSYYLPIIPRRADHYRLRLTGTGGCRIYSLVREFYSGSELKSKNGRN